VLFQPSADLVEQIILLPIDLAAGLIVSAPGGVTLRLQIPHRATSTAASFSTLSDEQRLVNS
jgi:hypothetical protein